MKKCMFCDMGIPLQKAKQTVYRRLTFITEKGTEERGLVMSPELAEKLDQLTKASLAKSADEYTEEQLVELLKGHK